MNEVWKDIEGYEGLYQISSLGRVKSLVRSKERILIPILHGAKRAYGYIHLINNGKRCDIAVHRLVAKTFIPNPLNKGYVNHTNGIKDDNRVENLEWVTSSENQLHAYNTGLKEGVKGENNHNAKRTNYEVRKVKTLHKLGMMQRDIAKVTNMDYRTVNRIVKEKIWRHIA